MADTQVVEILPCPREGCDGAGDNARLYEDGSVKCFGCGAKWRSREKYERESAGDVVGDRGEGSRLPAPTPGVLSVSVRALDKLSLKTCQEYGYGYTKYGGQVWKAAPYRDETGTPCLWKLRSKDKDFLLIGDKDRAQPFFGQHLQTSGKMLVLTVGEKDAMAAREALGNRWPAWSGRDGDDGTVKAVKQNVGVFDQFDKVVLLFDMDESGRKAALAAARALPPGKAYIGNLPLKDAHEMHKAGRKMELKDAIWNAPRWAPSGLLEGPELLAAIQGKFRPAFATYPFPELQRMTRGIRPAEIVLLVAASGAGKSTLSRTLAYHLVDQGVKVGILTLEETLDQFMVPFVGYGMGENLRLRDADPTSDPRFVEAFERMKDRVVGFDDDGNRDPDAIFDRIRYMKQALACDVILLDHLTVVLGAGVGKRESSNEFTDRLMSRIEVLVKQTQATLLLVTHLRKVGTGSKSFSAGGQVSLDDVKGSSLIADLSHTIVARERDQQGGEDGGLRLLKCRLSGTGELGFCDKLRFVRGTGMVVADLDDPAERFEVHGEAVEETEDLE